MIQCGGDHRHYLGGAKGIGEKGRTGDGGFDEVRGEGALFALAEGQPLGGEDCGEAGVVRGLDGGGDGLTERFHGRRFLSLDR
mmetsp:Transcript_1342/g.2397  ORF Transcript_1342/g.2397 Transcript_1342/m.2397 type:complete len:83 (+) Transcript_1342:3-251(+)